MTDPSPAPNSKDGRRRRWQSPAETSRPVVEPTAIILSVKLDNGAFESSVTVPLNEYIDFDKHAARWLALAHTALAHGVEEMKVLWSPTDTPDTKVKP